MKTGELPFAKTLTSTREFQSTPVSEDGRTLNSAQRGKHAGSFNPRPSVKTGERSRNSLSVWIVMFQSTPVSEDGRTRKHLLRIHLRSKFQSTPVSEDGRTVAKVAHTAQLAMFQSTPVSEDGRTARAGQ